MHLLQGATSFLQSLAQTCGTALFNRLPILHKLMLEPLLVPTQQDSASAVPALDAKAASDALYILQITGTAVARELVPQILQALPAVVRCFGHPSIELRRVAISCAVALADAQHAAVLPLLLR